MIPFIFFIHQLFHVLLPWIFNPFLAYYHITWYTFQTVSPRYILPFSICFAIRKISFCWLGSFKSLAHSFCFFDKEITLIAFCLLFLYSFHPSIDFFSFHPSIDFFSSFPSLLQQLPHSTTMFPYACMGLLTIHMWPVLRPQCRIFYGQTPTDTFFSAEIRIDDFFLADFWLRKFSAGNMADSILKSFTQWLFY